MWSIWDARDITDNLPKLIAIIDSNTEIYPEEYRDKNRAAITSLTERPLTASELQEGFRHHELGVIGFALDICGRRAAQQGEAEMALDLLHASHEIFRWTNPAFKPSKPMRQVLENALKVLFKRKIERVVAGEIEAAELREEMRSFVISAWSELPPQLALMIDERILIEIEDARSAREDDTQFHERFVRDNIDTVLKLDIPKRLEEVRRRWEETGQHVAPSATRIAAKSLQRPLELKALLSEGTWQEIAACVEHGDSMGLAKALDSVDDALEGNLKLRLDAKPDYLEPTSEIRFKNSPDPGFLEARDLMVHQGVAGLDAFRMLHFRKGSNVIAKEWYAFALTRFGRRTDIHEIIGLLEDAIASQYFRSDVSWSVRWNLACALRRIPDRSEEALEVLLPLLDNETHSSEVFELCLLWALELKNEDVLRDLLLRSIHYEAHLLAALRELEESRGEDHRGNLQVHFRRINHILKDPSHVFPEPKERLAQGEIETLTREFLEHSLVEAGIEWFRQRLSYGQERNLYKNWESMARLQEEVGEYKAAWRCREHQWRLTARNPRLALSKKAGILRAMLTWGQRHGFQQQSLSLLKAGWRDAGFNEGDVSLWEQRLIGAPTLSLPQVSSQVRHEISRQGLPPDQKKNLSQIDPAEITLVVQQLAGTFASVNSTEKLAERSPDAERLLKAVEFRHPAIPPDALDAIRAVLRLAVEFGGSVSSSAAEGRLEEFRGRLDALRQQRGVIPFELTGLAQACERVVQNLAVKAQALPEIAITPPNGLHFIFGRPALGSRRISRLFARLTNPGPEPISSIAVTFLSPSRGIRINPAPVAVPALAPEVGTLAECPVELDDQIGDEIEVRILVNYEVSGFPRTSQATSVIPVEALPSLPPRYVTSAPLSTDRTDLFHGRERELAELQRTLTASRMLKLYFVNGIRAVGKSTLMRHLGARCSPELLPILIPLEAVLGERNMTPMQLVRQFCRISVREAQHAMGGSGLELKIPDAEAFSLDPPWVVFEEFLEQLYRQTSRRILLCIDEMQLLIRRIADPSDPIDEGFLGWLRDQIQSGSNLRVVCTGSENFGQLRKRHDHVVWRNMEPYDISFVDRSAMERIATIPVKDDRVIWLPEALDRLWDYTEGHPCVTQILAERTVVLIDFECRRVISPLDVDRAYEAVPHDLEIWELWWNEKEAMVTSTHRQLAFLILQNQPASRVGLEEMELAELAAKSGIRAAGRYLDEMQALEVLTLVREGEARRWRVRGAFLERYLLMRLQRTLQETVGEGSTYSATAPLAVMLDYENVKIGLSKVLDSIPASESELLRPRLEASDLATRLLEAATRFGVPRQRWAVADWDRTFFQGDQKALKMARYSTDIAGHGEKNSSDHVLREKIHFVLREHPEISVFVIGTGDADFHETIKTLQEQGKYVILWSTRNQINRVYAESLRGPDRIRIEWLEDLIFEELASKEEKAAELRQAEGSK